MQELGTQLNVCCLSLKGDSSIDACLALIDKVVDAIGMTKAQDATCYHYPFMNKGGTGTTIVQPITESFLVVDSWVDFDGIYLLVASCKDYDEDVLRDTVKANGYRVVDHLEKSTVSLDENRGGN